MTTLVTCGTGSVSQAFIRVLHEQTESIHVLIRNPNKRHLFSREKVFVGGLFDREILSKAVRGVDTIVHVPPRVYPEGDIEHQLSCHRQYHVESTRLLMEEALQSGVKKFLYLSSAHAGGRSCSKVLCEISEKKPDTPYGQAKKEAEGFLLKMEAQYSLQVVILRPPGIYGPGTKSMLTTLFKAAQKGLFLPFKGVRAYHSLIFVDDLARAGLALLELPFTKRRHAIFIVKDPCDYYPEELYAVCCVAVGKNPRLFWLPAWVLKSFGSLKNFLVSRRYCDHLFKETLPDFKFLGLNQAIQSFSH